MGGSSQTTGLLPFGIAVVFTPLLFAVSYFFADANISEMPEDPPVMSDGPANTDVIFIQGLNIESASSNGSYVKGDAVNGARIWKKCQACHQVGPNAKNRVGPHLNEVFGRVVGSVENYRYSQGATDLGLGGLTWDVDTISTFISNPKALIADTKMNYSGLEDGEDKTDLLAFIGQFSDAESDSASAALANISPEVELPTEVLAIEGDRDWGEYLGSECQTCHQVDGSDDGIPSIIGWPTEEFVIAMHAYKQKIRGNPVMQLMAGKLSNDEIAALAVYFEGLE